MISETHIPSAHVFTWRTAQLRKTLAALPGNFKSPEYRAARNNAYRLNARLRYEDQLYALAVVVHPRSRDLLFSRGVTRSVYDLEIHFLMGSITNYHRITIQETTMDTVVDRLTESRKETKRLCMTCPTPLVEMELDMGQCSRCMFEAETLTFGQPKPGPKGTIRGAFLILVLLALIIALMVACIPAV